MAKTLIAAAAALSIVALAPSARADQAAAPGDVRARQAGPEIDARARDVVEGSAATVEDQVFVRKAAEGSAAEVELAELALDKSQNADVRKFAEQMKRDHSAAQGILKNSAVQEGIEVPTTLDDEHETIMSELEKLDGREFDERYMTYMVEEHKKDLALFAAKARTGDGDVSAYAQRMVSVLDTHLEMARDVSEKLEDGAAGDPRQGKADTIDGPGNDATLR